jgi:hypothetical protein
MVRSTMALDLETIMDFRFEAPKPMALAAMIPLDCIRVGFAHDQFLRWDHRSIDRPMISTLERDIP